MNDEQLIGADDLKTARRIGHAILKVTGRAAVLLAVQRERGFEDFSVEDLK